MGTPASSPASLPPHAGGDAGVPGGQSPQSKITTRLSSSKSNPKSKIEPLVPKQWHEGFRQSSIANAIVLKLGLGLGGLQRDADLGGFAGLDGHVFATAGVLT